MVSTPPEASRQTRRLVARLRRLVVANRAALTALPAQVVGLYDADARQDLRAAIERLEAVGQDLDLVQERARLLQEEIAARIGEATNRNLFVLSIATTTLLPITLITGIFGMNRGGMPLGKPSRFALSWRASRRQCAGALAARRIGASEVAPATSSPRQSVRHRWHQGGVWGAPTVRKLTDACGDLVS